MSCLYSKQREFRFCVTLAARFAAMLVGLLMTAAVAPAQTVVVGTADPYVDVPAVQAAVDGGGDVRLVGTFSFDRPPVNGRSVLVSNSVNITGAENEQGGRAIIRGGWRSFQINAPGSRVSIEGIHFILPELFAIELQASRGLRVTNCKVQGLQPRNLPPVGMIGGALSFGSPNRANVTGDITILNNEIDGLGGSATERTYGILILGVGIESDPVDIQVAGNRVTNVTGHGIDLRQLIGRATVERNQINTGAVGGQQVSLADSFVDGIRVLGTGSYVVRHNTIECGFENSAGIRVQGNSAGMPAMHATIESNDITMSFPGGTVPGSQSAGIEVRRAATENAVLHNRITGRARAAIALISDPTPIPGVFLTPGNNTFVGNNVSTFNSTVADALIGPRVYGTTIVGGHGSVDDHGVATLINGGWRSLTDEHYHASTAIGEIVAEAEQWH